jgi:hypothetical protein
LAEQWLDQYYDHDCLQKLRTRGIQGPIPSMLSFDAPALTIFGLMSPQIINIADELANLSGFPIVIRPVMEDPSAPLK